MGNLEDSFLSLVLKPGGQIDVHRDRTFSFGAKSSQFLLRVVLKYA